MGTIVQSFFDLTRRTALFTGGPRSLGQHITGQILAVDGGVSAVQGA